MGRHRLNYSHAANDARRLILDDHNHVIERTPELLVAHDYTRMVGARLRRLRTAADLTQAETVGAVERPRGGRYSTGLLSRMEHGWANPPMFVYVHVAEALGTDPAQLLGPEPGAGSPAPGELRLLEALRSAGINAEAALSLLLREAAAPTVKQAPDLRRRAAG